MKRKMWFLIIGGVLGLALVAAAVSFFVHSGAGVLKVSDLKAQAASLQERFVTVKGKVAPGSVSRDGATQVTNFAITDEKSNLFVTYQGILPDSFKPGAEMEIQGKYRADGVLEAQAFNRPASVCIICHG